MLTRSDIEKQIEIEQGILGELESRRYEDKAESLTRHYQPAPDAPWVHEDLPGAEFYPAFPHWWDTVRLRIGALQLMLERLPRTTADPSRTPERVL
jgi:hypothetical protein